MFRLIGHLTLTTCLALAACVQTGATRQDATAMQAAAAPTAPSGRDQTLQGAASVVRVDFVPNQSSVTAKLFGVAGGDPAMNGLYTYLALQTNPHDDWQIHPVGDFLDYRIVSAAPGQVTLEIRESTPSTETSEIGSRARVVVLTWTLDGDGGSARVTVTPAE